MIHVQKDISLVPYTTFQIGGPARYFVEVRSKEELKEALAWAREHSEGVFIMGEGSNVLIADKGLDMPVVLLQCGDMVVEDESIRCFAGCRLMRVVEAARDEGLRGMEYMAGIPGSVGGAVRGNAGAFGTEAKDVAREVTAIHRETLEEKTFSHEACEFSYRSSFFKKHPQWVVAEAVFGLSAGEPEALAATMEETLAKRNEKQYQDVRSAGSFFVNPVIEDKALRKEFENESGSEARGGKIPAGWLIDKVGLRGKKIGGAQVSKQHPNYILNTGGATAEDVVMLASLVTQKVRDTYNVELEREVQYVGFT